MTLALQTTNLTTALDQLRTTKSHSYVYGIERTLATYQGWVAGRPDESLVTRLEAFGAWLVAKGNKPQTAGTRLTQLKAVLRKAAKASGDIDLMDSVDRALRHVEAPAGQRDSRLVYWLSTDEVRAVLASSKPKLRDHAILACLLGLGMRRSEVAGLTWEQFEQRDGHTIVTVTAKGRVRSIPVPPGVARALERHANGQQAGRLFEISDQAVLLAVRRHCKAAGITKAGGQPGPHDLRRTFARHAWQGGMDLIDLAAVLGHADVATTQRYIGVDQDPDRMNPDRYLAYSDAFANGKGA